MNPGRLIPDATVPKGGYLRGLPLTFMVKNLLMRGQKLGITEQPRKSEGQSQCHGRFAKLILALSDQFYRSTYIVGITVCYPTPSWWQSRDHKLCGSWEVAGWGAASAFGRWEIWLACGSLPALSCLADSSGCLWRRHWGRPISESELGCAGPRDCSGLHLQSGHFTQQIVVI